MVIIAFPTAPARFELQTILSFEIWRHVPDILRRRTLYPAELQKLIQKDHRSSESLMWFFGCLRLIPESFPV